MSALTPLERTAKTAAFLAADPLAAARPGQTPHVLIHRQNKARLLYFAPAAGTEVRRPLFVCMPLINTWTIFDLMPGRSVIERLVAAGIPVYLLDWGSPGPEDHQTRMAELVDGLLHRAFDRARRHARRAHQSAELDALGYCVGGTILSIYLARHPDAASRAVFLATPIDFHRSGRLSRWVQPGTYPLDRAVEGLGNFPADNMRSGFALLKPAGQTGKWVGLWERIDDPDFPALWSHLERWSSEAIAFPGEVYREYIRRCYFENRLMTGGWILGGRPVELSAARMPALVLAATTDHIVEPAAASALEQVWGGPVETCLIRGGHVGVCVGGRMPRALIDWLNSDAGRPGAAARA